MEKVITRPQTCDMGSGFGKIEVEPNTTLRQVLEFYKNNSRTWGVCTIQFEDGEILRKFDYDVYRNDIFYYHLSWELNWFVVEAKFQYCFMGEDLTITIRK